VLVWTLARFRRLRHQFLCRSLLLLNLESDQRFVAKVAEHADKLIGHYGWKEHQACCAQIPNACLNRVFEVVGIKYPSCPEPDAPASAGGSKKRKGEALDKEEVAPRKKISVKRKRRDSQSSDSAFSAEFRKKSPVLRRPGRSL
jgi:hypothetical protein